MFLKNCRVNRRPSSFRNDFVTEGRVNFQEETSELPQMWRPAISPQYVFDVLFQLPQTSVAGKLSSNFDHETERELT